LGSRQKPLREHPSRPHSMASLTFASLGPVTSPGVVPLTAQKHGIFAQEAQFEHTSRSWGVSGGLGATVSATFAAVAGRALYSKGRKLVQRPVVLRAFDPSKEVGAIDPLGYWDPLNLMREGFKNKQGEFKSEETFRWYRAAELKHGRISMLALLGLASGTMTKFYGFEDVPSGLAALQTGPGGAGMGLIVLVAGIFELEIWKQDPSKQPGDFGDLIVQTFGDDKGGADYWSYSDEMRNKELAHCRLAMSAIITSFLLEYSGVSPEAQFNIELWPAWVKALGGASFIAWLTYTNDNYYIADDASVLGPVKKPQPALLTAGNAPNLVSEEAE